MAKIVKIYFDGVEKECLVQTNDQGNQIAVAKDGEFLMFAKDADVDAEVAAHNADPSNREAPLSGEDVARRDAELAEWLTPEAREARGIDDPVDSPATTDTAPVPGSEAAARQNK